MRARCLAAILAVVSMLGVAATRPAAAAAVRASMVALAGTPRPPLLKGARLLGAVPPGERLQLEVTLQLPDPTALASFVTNVNERSSPLFGDFLAPGQFAARFGPSDAEVAAVTGALRAAGLRPGPVSANHLSIPVVASVATIERAFRIEIDRYRLAGGRIVFSNASAAELPSNVAGSVDAVLGLDDIAQVHNMLVRSRHEGLAGTRAAALQSTPSIPAAGPQPCAAAVGAESLGGYTSNVLASHYGLTPLYSLGDSGAAAHVALVEFEPHLASDIATFESCYRIHTVVKTINVLGGSGSGGGSGEAALDIEDVASLAPDVTIDVYNAPGPGTDAQVEAEYGTIVRADRDQVISSSWGECELDTDKGLITSEEPLFSEAAAQGQTVLSAAGDDGSTDCYSANASEPNANVVSADDPGSQPNVVSVGGTTFASHDVVWNDSASSEGAGGGGISVDHCMPSYQDQPAIEGLINANSKAGCGGNAGSYFRETPDVAADADPNTGIVIYYEGDWFPIGGTSMAAPLWGAIAALIDASPYCSFYGSGDAGARPAALYDIAASGYYGDAFTDVTSGNNDYTPSSYTGGLYPASAGYDDASGLGYPQVVRPGNFYIPGVAALMCYEYSHRNFTAAISGIGTSTAAPNGTIPIEIVGRGFLPIPGAERLIVNGVQAGNIACISETQCSANLPASARSGATVRVVVEDLSETAAVSYTYAPEGFWLAGARGGVYASGAAPPLGGVSVPASTSITGISSAPGGHGYWLVAADGAAYAKGSARYEGSLPADRVHVNDIVAIAPTGDGGGYWLIGRDGGEFAFGDARYHGSLPGDGVHVDDIAGMVATANGGGYWLVGSDGGVFAFGNAGYVGSLPGVHVHVSDIRAMIASPTRAGYVLVGSDGGTFVFGRGVRYFGSLPGRGVHVDDITSLALTPDGGGYWLAGSNASVYAFGDAFALSVPAAARLHLPIVAIASS
jgi:hypothetical protein